MKNPFIRSAKWNIVLMLGMVLVTVLSLPVETFFFKQYQNSLVEPQLLAVLGILAMWLIFLIAMVAGLLLLVIVTVPLFFRFGQRLGFLIATSVVKTAIATVVCIFSVAIFQIHTEGIQSKILYFAYALATLVTIVFDYLGYYRSKKAHQR